MPRRRYHVSLTFEGCCFAVIAAFILAGALARQINLLMILFGLLAGAFIVHWRMVKRMLRKIEVERRLPASALAGELVVVEFTGTNRRRRLGAWALDVTDTLRREGTSKSGPPIKARALFSYIPPGESCTTSYRGRLMERGRYRFGPLQIASRFPLGFLQYRLTFDAGGELLVYPRLGRLTPAWRRWQEGRESEVGKTSPRQGLLEGEFYGLRDWRSGDSRRLLHWRTSARRQAPVVRQFEQQRDGGLAIVLDFWQPERANPVEIEAVESAASFVATVTADLCRSSGRRLCLAASGQRPWLIEGPASAALLDEAMRQLAASEAGSDDGLPQSLSDALDRVRRGARILVVSTRPVDLVNDRRFESIRNTSQRGKWLFNSKTINTSGNDLGQWFQVA